MSNITLRADQSDQVLIDNLSCAIHPGQFVAIIGASGSGKSTLLKLIAGIHEQQEGSIHWNGRDLITDQDLHPSEVGYVPQFSIAYEHLTVWENVDNALQLRVAGIPPDQQRARVQQTISEVGLADKEDRLVRVLSGGEKRRLALAIELVGNPAILLSDEATSGLDPVSEEEVMNLLRDLSRHENRIVASVTHSMHHLHLYDLVIILDAGRLMYAGPPSEVTAYFGVARPEGLYHRTATLKPFPEALLNPMYFQGARHPHQEEPPQTPGFIAQTMLLLKRRWHIFFRDRAQCLLQLGLILGFPAVIVLFALNGLPQIRNLTMAFDTSLLQQLAEAIAFTRESTRAGALVSGLVMFQIVLMTIMAANNSAREITEERLILEKEKLAGLLPGSYVASKCLFLAGLVLLQSLWMTIFVKLVCDLPGNFWTQLALLASVNAAVTFLCLAISSLSRTSEQSSLTSIYLVGFQLPFSGAVLSLPDGLAAVTRPFIASYWGWSGYVTTMKDTRLYDMVKMVSQTDISPIHLCLCVLWTHVVFSIIITYVGCRHSRWHTL